MQLLVFLRINNLRTKPNTSLTVSPPSSLILDPSSEINFQAKKEWKKTGPVREQWRGRKLGFNQEFYIYINIPS